MADTVTDDILPTIDPNALLAGEMNASKLDAFRAAVFQSVESLQDLRDWLHEPRAKGTARGIALWALGQHADAANPSAGSW